MANIMMHAPATGNQSHTVNGRRYNGAAGSPQLVPDFDAAALEANGWTVAGDAAGTTAQRPTNPQRGSSFNDTTIGKTVKWDGRTWRDAITGAAA